MTGYDRYFTADHDLVRRVAREWVTAEIIPHVDDWEEAGEFPRDLYTRAADIGLLLESMQEIGVAPLEVIPSPNALEEMYVQAVRESHGAA